MSFPTRTLLLLTLLAPAAAQAANVGGEYAPILNLGIHFFSGDSSKSNTGQTQYYLDFQAERRKGFFRPSIAMEMSFSSGTASIGSATSSYTLYGAGFLGGFNLFAFTEGRFQPYLGGMGIASWNLIKLGSPPTGTDANTQAFGFGYEVNAGVDIRLGSSDGQALRIQGGYWNTTAGLAGVSGFQLSGIRFQLAIVY